MGLGVGEKQVSMDRVMAQVRYQTHVPMIRKFRFLSWSISAECDKGEATPLMMGSGML